MNKICRICLSTDKTLWDLNEELLSYFQDICDYTSEFSEHMCCSTCKDSLKNNLDFRNKCLKSNKILQDWKNNKSQTKTPIQSLHKILLTYLNCLKEESIEITNENISKPKNCEFNTEFNNKNDENIHKYVNDNEYHGNNENIKVETVKDEVENDIFEVIDCGTELDVNGNGQGMLDDENDVNDNDESDDDKLLIDCVSESKKSKNIKTENKSKVKVVKSQEKRVYKRKGLSEYLQYEAVFDIQLFTTDEEARREVLQRQISEPYLSAQHRCSVCYTVYKCDKLLQFHMKWHDTSEEFVCDICSMRFAARKALQCHKAKCHRGKFTCKMCPLITYYGSAMKAHFQKHQGKIFKCHCDRVFNHISSYLSHKRTVHASSHVCVTCARTFVSELGLLNHRLRAHQTKSKVDSDATAHCEPCGLTFTSEQVYTVHVLNTDSHKDLAKDMIACPYCGLAFEDLTQLKAHKRQYHPKKKDTNDTIICKLCGAEGLGRTWRRRHYGAEHPHVRYLEEVSEARAHMCDQCGKRFSNICLMKDHMNTHLGVKPYSCSRCRAAFSSSAARALHAERHAPPRRQCPACPRAFRSAANLAVHARTHSGVRRHACDACDKAFLHRAALREHVRGVHRHERRARHKSQH